MFVQMSSSTRDCADVCTGGYCKNQALGFTMSFSSSFLWEIAVVLVIAVTLISPQAIRTGVDWLLAAARAVSLSFQLYSSVTLDLCSSVLLSAMASSSLFVVSIDFGTSYSGYCFSLASGTDQIRQVFWGTEHGHSSLKTPTCILFNENQEFAKFGYDAVMKYKSLPASEAHKWYFFRNFKMSLYNRVCRALTGVKAVCLLEGRGLKKVVKGAEQSVW